MTAPKDIKDISAVTHQQQMLLITKLLSKGMSVSGSNSFDALLSASISQVDPQGSPFNKGLSVQSLPALPALPGASPTQIQEGDAGRFKEILATVLKHEGSAYVQRDGGGAESSKFGILQSTAREYGYNGNIKNISRADAEAIYKKIWDKSGAASLPYPLSLVHFDSYVNSPTAAMKLLKKSGGNTETYLSMRAMRYTRLAELRPERFAKYLKGWINRVADLRNIAAVHSTIKHFAANNVISPDKTENKTLKT